MPLWLTSEPEVRLDLSAANSSMVVMSDGSSSSDENQQQLKEGLGGANARITEETSESKEGQDNNREAHGNAIETDRQQAVVDDPLFQKREGLFQNKKMVRVGWVPDGDRIVGRDDYINDISSSINDAVFGEAPSHISITGKTGTGKSLVSRFVTQRAENAAIDGINFGFTYIDCSKSSTELQVISTVGQNLNNNNLYENIDQKIKMPDTGLPKDKFYKRFWSILDHYNAAIIILDEVDLLQDDRVLMSLAKAVESNDTSCHIGIIAISNRISYFEDLNPRTKSAFQAEEMNFDPYNANDLREILRGREDAFQDGVLSDDVIPLVAALSAQEHGDARKAMRLFRTSGEIADREYADEVREEHVRNAQDKLEKDRFRDFLEGTPTQMKAACLAIATKSLFTTDDYIITGELYETYRGITDKIDMAVIGIRRFRDILDEMQLSQVIETKEQNWGKGGGRHNSHRLLHDPQVVLEIVMQDSRFEDIAKPTLRNYA